MGTQTTIEKNGAGEFARHFEPMATNRQAMELLQVDAVTLWRWRRDGQLPFYRAGNRIRYKYSDLKRFLEKKVAAATA